MYFVPLSFITAASVCDEEDATPLHYTARKKQQDLHLDDSSELDTSLPEVKVSGKQWAYNTTEMSM